MSFEIANWKMDLLVFQQGHLQKSEEESMCQWTASVLLQGLQQEGALHRMFSLTGWHDASTERPVRGKRFPQEAD